MSKSSEVPKHKYSRDAIIGLGEASFKKNYYPELQKKILELEKYNTRNKAIIDTMPDVLLIGDRDGSIRHLGYWNTDDQLDVEVLLDDSNMRPLMDSWVAKVIDTGEPITQRYEYINKDKYYLEIRLNRSDLDEALIIIRDITDQTLLELELRNYAERDSMTYMYNRRVFENKMFEFDNLPDVIVGIIILDIDGLKVINDTLGHQMGDEAIIIVAEMIEGNFGKLGLTARLSGDEFGVIGTGINVHQVEAAIKDMNAEIVAFNDASDRLQLSISFGYAEHQTGTLDIRDVFREADNNMYQHKMFKSSSVRSSLVKTLMKALEVRDYITEGHADRMDQAACDLGRTIGLARHQIDKLKLLAKFHDIGKVGIPDRILNKPGKLDEEEYKIMKTHTHIGKRIASESVDLHDVADLIYFHHEHWDGNGYPDGLKGIDIPIECRILALVDAYDAMTNDRPYRKAMTEAAAKEEIRDHRGSQFDPELTDLFLAL